MAIDMVQSSIAASHSAGTHVPTVRIRPIGRLNDEKAIVPLGDSNLYTTT